MVGKRFPTGGGEILRRREMVVLATGNAVGQSVADGRNTRTGRRCPVYPVLGDRLDGLGPASGQPTDQIRRGAKQGYGIVLVAQPIDQCSAVENNLEVSAGNGVANGCRQRLGLEFVDQFGESFFEMRMCGVAGRFRRAGLEEIVEAGARDPPVSGDGVGRRRTPPRALNYPTRSGKWNSTDLIARRSGKRLRVCQHPYAPAIKLNRKAIRRIDCTLIQGRHPYVARPIDPCLCRLSKFICQK